MLCLSMYALQKLHCFKDVVLDLLCKFGICDQIAEDFHSGIVLLMRSRLVAIGAR